MNRNTILWIAAGVGVYLLLRKLNKASGTSGVGQTVDWRNLPMPGMSMGGQHPWVDESIAPPQSTAFMRSGRLAEFNSVEAIGAAEFGGHQLGMYLPPGMSPEDTFQAINPGVQLVGGLGAKAGFRPQMPQLPSPQRPSSGGMSMGPIGSPLPSLGQNAGMSMGPIGSMLPRLQQPGNPEGSAGMSMGRIGPMLPSLATGTYDYGRGRSLTDDEARAQSRTAGGFGGTGRPGSGGAPRSGAMLPSLATGTYDYGRGQSLTDEEARKQARTAGGFGSTGRPGGGGEYRSGAMLPRLSTGTFAPTSDVQASSPSSAQWQPAGRPDIGRLQAQNPNVRFADQPSSPPDPRSQMQMPAVEQMAMEAGQSAEQSMVAQGTRQFGSDSWGGDAGTSMDRIPNVI